MDCVDEGGYRSVVCFTGGMNDTSLGDHPGLGGSSVKSAIGVATGSDWEGFGGLGARGVSVRLGGKADSITCRPSPSRDVV